MDDDDGLDAIRQRRLAEMQAQYAGGAVCIDPYLADDASLIFTTYTRA